jgi:diadenosine tetraphosphate (Ap4A) HIT family hydrolase
MEKDCPLCKLATGNIKTKLYYQDKIVIIVNCLTCKIPMIVLKRHTMKPNNFERAHMEMVPKELFGPNIKFRKKPSKILDHIHWHILGGKA